MRWEALFADMEARLAHAADAERDAEAAEIYRSETGTVTLAARLRAHAGGPVSVRTRPAGVYRGVVAGVGSDVVLLVDDVGREVLVMLGSVVSVTGLTRHSSPEPGPATGRLGSRAVLRGLARGRVPVRVTTANGDVDGLVQRVGADHVDVVPVRHGDADATAPAAGTAVALAGVVAIRPG